jgi:hypothetical protein
MRRELRLRRMVSYTSLEKLVRLEQLSHKLYSDVVIAPRYTPLSRQVKTISTKDAEEWEKKIMEDPKVRRAALAVRT